MRTALIAATILAAVLAAGCSSSSDAPPEADLPALGALPRIEENAQVLNVPFNTVFESQRDLAIENDAYERLMSVCTTKLGFDFVPGDDYHPTVMLFDFAMPYGPVDLSRASRYGYHDPDFVTGPQSPEWDGETTPQWVLDGKDVPAAAVPAGASVPTGGCTSQVQEALGGVRPTRALGHAESARSQSGTDPRGDQAVKKWTECMRADGYPFKGPLEPLDKFQGEGGRGEPSAEEIAVATADVTCKSSTREVDTLVALSIAYQQRAINQHADDFDAYQAWKTTTLSRAREAIVSTPPPPNRYFVTAHGKVATDPLLDQ